MTDVAKTSTRLHVDGLDEAIAAYDQLYGDLLELQPIMKTAADDMASAARYRVHSDTYRLAGSIYGIATGAVGEVWSSAIYAEVQQWGWGRRNIPAQHYVSRAIAQEWSTIQRDTEAAVAKMVADIGGQP